MKAEEKTVAFMFFSVVMQFVYSLGKKKQKKKTEFGGGWRGTRAEGDRRAKFLWRITGHSSKKMIEMEGDGGGYYKINNSLKQIKQIRKHILSF